MIRRKCTLKREVHNRIMTSEGFIPLVKDWEMFDFQMEMIDHLPDANEKHSSYCMTSHPDEKPISNMEFNHSSVLTRFFLIIEIGKKCRAESNIAPR